MKKIIALKMAARGSRRQVEAEIVAEVFGIHESVRGDMLEGSWAVTHVPTGMLCAIARTKGNARKAVSAFRKLPIDWPKFSRDKCAKLAPDIRAKCAAIQQAAKA